jgi:hypothetical protein
MRKFMTAIVGLLVSQTLVMAQPSSPNFKVACFTKKVTAFPGDPIICSPPLVWRYGDYCECLYFEKSRVSWKRNAGIVRLVPASAKVNALRFTNWGVPLTIPR